MYLSMCVCLCVIYATRDREAPPSPPCPFSSPGKRRPGPAGRGRACGQRGGSARGVGQDGAARPRLRAARSFTHFKPPLRALFLSSAGPGRMFILRNVNTGSGVL